MNADLRQQQQQLLILLARKSGGLIISSRRGGSTAADADADDDAVTSKFSFPTPFRAIGPNSIKNLSSSLRDTLPRHLEPCVCVCVCVG